MNLTTKQQIAARHGATLVWRDETVNDRPCTRFYLRYQGRETKIGGFSRVNAMSAARFTTRVQALVESEATR